MVNCSCDFLSIKSDKEDDVLKLLGLLYFYLGPPGGCVGSFEVIKHLHDIVPCSGTEILNNVDYNKVTTRTERAE